ncbi:hypothetical protein [Flavobacterium suncheonense]|uniref:hypothetical protein n=1 Tax=Flavobacterium suncheonense TaxID=350894 RepID=UPI003FA36847
MKTFLLSLFLCLFSSSHYAQKDKIIYLDSLKNETTYSNCKSWITIKDFDQDKNSYEVKSYYKSGKLKFEGEYTNKYSKQENGLFVYYYESGNKEYQETYIEGLKSGKSSSWYENGTKKTEGEYTIIKVNGTKSSEFTIINHWDENGNQKVINGYGILTETDKTESAVGEIKKGVKHGLWEAKSTNSKRKNPIIYSETYNNGVLLSGTSFNEDGQPIKYTELNTAAAPKNGMQNFRKKIAQKIDIPTGLNNPVILLISFVINKDGSISNINTIRSNNLAIENSVKTALSNSQNWSPALQRGLPVKSQFTLPITIQIN